MSLKVNWKTNCESEWPWTLDHPSA